jgi:hypothetical protein
MATANPFVVGGEDDPPCTFAVGDQVALVLPLRGRPELAVGTVGTVEVAGLVWGAVGVRFPLRRGEGLYQVLPRHLVLVARPECEQGGGNSDGAAADQAGSGVHSYPAPGVAGR